MHVSFSTFSVVAMSRARISCLVVLMIVLQSLTAVVEAHAFDQPESTHSAHDALHPSLSDTPHSAEHSDSDEDDTSISHVLHCHHHGCHFPLVISGGVALGPSFDLDYINQGSMDNIPEAPITSLFRPPIA